MSDPHPPATPPPLPADHTHDWEEGSPRKTTAPDSPTITSAGQPQLSGEDFGIPNPFGRYTVTRLLGRGGMGAVFLAHDTRLDRPVALKIPTFGGTLTANQKERFLREARAISALRHPNICPVYEVDEEQGLLFLTMHYIDGQPLSALIEQGPMPVDRAVELVRRVARAMQVAHAHGTVHRDLKPANILIDRTGEPVVTDFGLARRAQWQDHQEADTRAGSADGSLTQVGAVLGTPAYMPPEQARGDQAAVGPRSDVYALGVILFELLTGRRQFTGQSTEDLIRRIESVPPPRLTEVDPRLSADLEAVCQRALAKDPADRFASMAEFERALKESVDPDLKVVLPPPLPAAGKPPGPREKPRKRMGALGYLAWILFGLTLILGLCVAVPTLAIYWLIGAAKDKVDEFTSMMKEIQQGQERSQAEWEAIMAFWQPPAADAPLDNLFPTHLPDGYRRVRVDRNVADPELGITLPGQRAFYNRDGAEYEVRAYRCPDADAQAIQVRVHDFAQSLQTKTRTPAPGSNRQQALYAAEDKSRRSVTFAFTDALSQNQEYGKLWYGYGWLFLFRTQSPLSIESFPSRYLMEVGKKASAPAKNPDGPLPPPPKPDPKASPGPLVNPGK